ncbi:DegV family protein [Mycoplasmatota bacterium]|nr:DegV family protein [Mycoplasmatota bacterium]
MKYKIIADSCCDINEDMKKNMNIELVPLSLQLEDKVFVDDESLNVLDYVKEMKACPIAPKTACPSPQDFINRYQRDEDTFVVTLSQELSGTYNSAEIARKIYLEEHKEKFIHVFNSKSASVGETLIALKIDELVKSGISKEEIVEKVDEFIKGMKTYFLLESLEHLAKAGRLKSYVAVIATLLKIKPIMGANSDGSIRLVHKVRGYKKAFSKLVDTISEEIHDFSDRILGIAHCNCLDKAIALKDKVLEKYNFKDIFIVEMQGLSSTYADDGGIVIAF